MKSRFRLLAKWLLRIFLIIVLIFGLWISLLAFPQISLKYKNQYGCCTVYSDEPFENNFKEIMNDVNNRLQAVEMHDSTKTPHVFIYNNPKLFAFFARLPLLRPDLQGYNLSIFGNTHICVDRINKLHEAYPLMPKYAITEGSLAHIVTHEIMHEYFVEAFGRMNNIKLPVWKREGLCEYGANIGAIRTDSTTSLKKRIDILSDKNNWDNSFEHSRNHYRWGLMVEYLAEIRNYSLADIFADTVLYDATLNSMSQWHSKQ